MAISQKGRLGKKLTGGKYHTPHKKRRYELGSKPTLTGIGKTTIKVVKTKGGGIKAKTLRIEKANLFDPKSKKFMQAAIKIVTDNPANRNYTRRNIITKGAIIMTEKGKARVTSRPGQNGSVDAVLIE